MFNISSLLEKFSKNLLSGELNKKEIAKIIYKNISLDVDPKLMEIKDYILYIEISPTLKNKLFTQKKAILDDIAISLSTKIIDLK